MLPLDALPSFRPFIATPAYSFGTTVPYSQSLFLLGNIAGKLGMDIGLEFRGESLIPRSRNELMAKFLVSSYTHLFFWDADVQASPEAFMRLLLADKDVAVGVYPLKNYKNWPPDPGITMQEFEERQSLYSFMPTARESDDDGFVQVYPAPTGFMCIQRDVFTKMMAAYPERRYVADKPDDLDHFDFFDPFIEPVSRRYWSEDYGFCYLWHEIGGEVWADTELNFFHIGTKAYAGEFGHWFRNQHHGKD